MNKKARDYVLLEYGHLRNDQVVPNQVCPDCNGGRSHERSFSVGKTADLLWWRCHRASCQFRGKQRVNGDSGDYEPAAPKAKAEREFKRIALPEKLKLELAEQYTVTPETIERARWSYTPDYGDGLGPRVIYPIFGPDGRVRGEQFRSYTGHVLKAKTTTEPGEQAICWYRFRKYSRILVILEDIPSALRVAETERMDALALLGTTLNLDRVYEIAECEYQRVWLALDGDATKAAIKAKKDFDPYLPSLRIKALGDTDVKDMTPDEFALFIQECAT